MREGIADLPASIRRERIVEVVRSREFVRVTALSEMFNTSEVTIRGDLDELARRGLVRRIRGGAMPGAPAPERPFEETESAHAEEKAAIAAAAAAQVSRGHSVLLDVGTTTTALARALVARHDLHEVLVVTNGLNIALELERAAPRLSVVVTGGTLRPLQHSLVDPLGTVVLERIRADTLFLGCNGVDPEAGITNANLPEAEIKRRMLSSARRRVVVADGSKIGAVHLAHLCDVDEVHEVITGTSADPPTVEAIRERGVEVQVVS